VLHHGFPDETLRVSAVEVAGQHVEADVPAAGILGHMGAVFHAVLQRQPASGAGRSQPPPQYIRAPLVAPAMDELVWRVDHQHLAVVPIHIGAALLRHLNVETTRGYVAVFDEVVIHHYQAHLQRRRRMPPPEDYRPVADDGWPEFQAHFDKRKVELGTCGRPYATPCIHEHACVRCPLLNVGPKMLYRLDVIETDLIARRERAEDEGWHGEIKGIDLTLGFQRSKRTDVNRRLRRSADLGIPSIATSHATSPVNVKR
jgi:hypothetical protein